MRCLLLLPVALAAVPAQSFVSPVHFAAAESPAGNNNPLGGSTPELRFLQIHEDLPATPITVRGMSFRRNGSALSAPAFSVEMAIVWSAGGTPTAAAPDPVFDANHATTRSTVLARRMVNFTAKAGLPVMPRPFEYAITFDTPVQASGRAVWDMQVFSRRNAGTIVLDAVSGSSLTNPPLAVLTLGQGCFATGQSTRLTVGGAAQIDWPNNQVRLGCSATNGVPNLPGVATIGFNTLQMNGVPLPFELPSSSAGASGACPIYNDIVVTLFGSFTAAGAFSTPLFSLPAGPELHGATIFHQVLEVDPAANALGLVSSGSLGRGIVAPYAAPAVGLVGTTTSATATSGIAVPRQGTIVQFVQ